MSNSCWEKGSAMMPLCAPKMQQSVTKGALQFMHVEGDIVQQ